MGQREADSPFGGASGTTGLVSWAVRTAAAAGLLCILAIQFLAGATVPDPVAAQRVAHAPGATRDPETTGSIAARSTRLDPCAVPARAGRP